MSQFQILKLKNFSKSLGHILLKTIIISFILITFKKFSDGTTNNSDYADTGNGSQKSLFASVAQVVGLRAELFDENGTIIETKDLWLNPLVNSWMSVIPQRYCFESETIGKLISFLRFHLGKLNISKIQSISIEITLRVKPSIIKKIYILSKIV